LNVVWFCRRLSYGGSDETNSCIFVDGRAAGGGLGLCNAGQENSRHVKLDASRASITREVFDAAAGELRAFAFQGFAITDPDSSLTPCFDLALQLADAFDRWVPEPP
jgi:hypothetical protein